jgi:hypothetical protein
VGHPALGTLLGVNIEWATWMKMAGALQALDNKIGNLQLADIAINKTAYGPAPWFGEITYTGRMCAAGWKNAKAGN